MPLCRHCHNELPHDIRLATCPVCGRIADADPTAGDRTEEFAVPLAAAAASPAAAAAGRTFAPDWAAAPSGQTFECEHLPPDVARAMNAVWLPAIDEQTAPHVTVKGAELPGDVSLARTLDSLRLASGDSSLPGGDVTLADRPQPEGDGPPANDKTLADGSLGAAVSRHDRTRSEAPASSDERGTVHSPGDETLSDLVIKQRNLRSIADADARSADAEYELISILGEGGMGIVYAARQRSINRSVAVKMLKRRGTAGGDHDAARQKFLAEAVVTGDLDHPNIVPIYDVGRNEHDALFYSMKRVHGTPWLEVLASKALHENLEILMKVADAVAFAHSRGVVHRDLKPENVMLGEFGEVQLMDWGLALPTARFDKGKRLLKTRGMGGTPAYMAPEMATGPLDRVGPHSDIYLLGAILFETVTGRRPHEGSNARECLIAAARNEIVRTRKTSELIEIALRAMATRPKDRYATVQDFQSAIRGYLSHTESIVLSTQADDDLRRAAQSDDYQDFSQAMFGFKEALKLWDGNTKARDGYAAARLRYAESAYRKGDYELGAGLLDLTNPTHAALYRQIQEAIGERDARQQRLNTARSIGRCLIGLVFAVVTCAAVWINAERQEAERQREQAVLAEREAREQKIEAERQRLKAEQQTQLVNQQRVLAERREREAELARKQAEKDREAALLAQAQEQEQRQRAETAAKKASLEQQRADAARRTADAARRAAESARQAEAYEGYVARIGLAAAKIRENAFGTALDLLQQCRPQAPDDADLRNWEWGRLMHLCSQAVRSVSTEQPLYSLAVSPDGRRFVAGGVGGVVRVYDRQTQLPLAELRHNGHDVHSIAFSPDSRLIATGSGDPSGFVRLWDADGGALVRTLGTGRRDFAAEHRAPVLCVGFSHDGRRLLTASQDETARVWDVASGTQIRRLWGHSGWVWSAAFCPERDARGRARDERRIVTASQDGTARIWIDRSAAHQPVWTTVDGDATFREHDGPVFTAAFSPDGRLVATGGHDRRVLLWDPERIAPDQIRERVIGQPVQETQHRILEGHTAPVRTLAFLDDGRHLVTGSDDNTVKLWNVATGNAFKTFRDDWSNTFRGHDSGVRAIAFPGRAWER
ncbi:MAG TPA: protein kinase, partial [Planctomycetaceae bacterium]|nr:protein kinase [Planctomycetaceae bacterium]